MSIKMKLISSYIFLILVTLASVALISQQTNQREIRAFIFQGNVINEEELITDLENFYQEHGSWDGVNSIFESYNSGQKNNSGAGKGGPGLGTKLRLADSNGYIVSVNNDEVGTATQITKSELSQSIPITIDNSRVGYLLPQEGYSLQTQAIEQDLQNRLNTAFFWSAVIAGSIAIILAFVLSFVLAKPIIQLKNASKNLSEGNFSERIAVSGKDEISDLGNTFNQMASSLERYEVNRRSMTADIAHELRTPLSVQRAMLEAIQDNIYPFDTERLDSILQQNLILTKLVEDLRTLALVDSNQLTLTKRPSNIAALIAAIANRFEAQANQKQIKIIFQSDVTNQIINIDPDRITQVISNILQNAIQHTPVNGTVFINMQLQTPYIVVAIRDTGPGIPIDALPYIFDRFYRAENSGITSDSGTGLGLAIAQQITRAHDGILIAENSEEGGALFTLRLKKNQ